MPPEARLDPVSSSRRKSQQVSHASTRRPNPPTLASHNGITGTTMKLNMRTGIHRLLLFVAIASTACGDSTEPSEHADVSGSWTYSAAYSVTLGALGATACSGSGVQATIIQSGSSVSGTARGGEWTCDSPAFALAPFSDENPGRISGTVEGNSVRFEVAGFVLLVHEGTVSGNSMSGTLTGTGTIAGVGSVGVTGTWSASR